MNFKKLLKFFFIIEFLFIFSKYDLAYSKLMSPPLNTLTGLQYLKAYHFHRAEKVFKKLLQENNTSLKDQFYLGMTAYYLHQFQTAEQCFDRVNDASPNLLLSHIYLARTYYDSNHLKTAFEEFNQANKINSQNYLIHYYLGLIDYKLLNIHSAIQEFQKAIKLSFKISAKAHYALAFLFFKKLNWTRRALREIALSLQSSPSSSLKHKLMVLRLKILKFNHS